MSLINSLRSGVGWISRRNVTARELIKSAKVQRLSLASRRRNAEVAKSHPAEPLPPLDMMADAHAHCDYGRYYEQGLFQARFCVDLFARNFDFSPHTPVQIFEWGCGTGRVIRHLRKLYDPATASLRSEDSGLNQDMWLARVPLADKSLALN